MFIIKFNEASKKIKSVARSKGIYGGTVQLLTYYNPKLFPPDEVLVRIIGKHKSIEITAIELR
jgi:hypothetical protein